VPHVGISLLTLFPGRVGGTETGVLGLLEQFAAGNGPERVTVLANRHVAAAYGRFERGPVRLHHVRSYRPGDSMGTRALAMAAARALPWAAARDVPPDLDVAHYAVTVPIPRVRVPSVVTIFDVQHLDLPDFFSAAERRYRRWAYEGAARRADVVVTASEHARRRLVESAGVAPERIEVVPLGIDHERFRPEPAESDGPLLAGHELPDRFVVFPANLWPHKNHERLIEALALTVDRGVALVLTGRRYGRAKTLQDAMQRAGVEERVHHLGFVEPAAMPALYRRALGMVFPSLYEGFGTPPLEAMACGCPVAASPRASLAEICDDAALLFDPESPAAIAAAIDRVATDTELRATLRAAGLRRARQFDWAASAVRHTQIYERAAAT
jgi:glycosyltransferase involved in cell wall biosynthesis